jgi:soluble lytic murein transglycosylase
MRPSIALSMLALLAFAAPAPAGMPAAPTCALWWEPGAPVAIWPHEAPPPEGRLAEDPSGALVAARAWLRAGRPDVALERVGALPAGQERDLLRRAALAAEGRWGDLRGIPLAAVPEGCGPLVDRWTALSAAAAGDPGTAAAAFGRLAAELPDLPGYVALWRLQAAALAGDVPAGEAAWAEINRRDVPRPARDDGRALLARLYERAGRVTLARQWRVTLASESRGGERADHLLAAARLAEDQGDRAAADDLGRRALEASPRAAVALVLDPASRDRLGLDPLEAARILLEAGRPDLAEPLASVRVERGPEDERRGALALRAEIRAARGDRPGAEADYAEFLSRWPNDPRAPRILYDRARLAERAGDGVVARERFLHFAEGHPGHDLAAAALYLAADSYQDDRDRDPAHAVAAVELFDRVYRGRPGSRYADRAYMRAAHLLYALGRIAEARDRYAAYRGSESSREARYWLARSAERMGDLEAARLIYRALGASEDYYALLARDRLVSGAGLSRFEGMQYRSGPVPPLESGASLLADPAGRRAAALLRFGERRYAQAELERVIARTWEDRERLAAWAPALSAWGFPDLTLRIGVRLREAGERSAYPTGFAAAIDNEARAHGLDAALMLALIRQESLFDAGAVSPAGARGLMQVMPETGRALAEAAGWPDFSMELLDVPAVSLHFGAGYLDARLREFEGFWPAVLASYNAGPEAVSQWWSFPERTLDPELWVDRIPYRETRDYVKKVLAQYAMYRRLYDDPRTAR